MGHYLDRIDALPGNKWAEARRLIFAEPLPFLAELRAQRPVWNLGEVTLVTRFADCMTVLRRHRSFGVDLYEPKQGGYFMAQDDTAEHWREKSLMKAVLDREEVPKMRDWIGRRTRDLLDGAPPGDLDLVRLVTRGVPVALVQEWFGLTRSDPDRLIDWSYWNQQDAFWNQPFDHVVPGIDQAAIVASRQRANVRMAFYLGRLVARRAAAVRLGSDASDPATRVVRLALDGGLSFGLRDALFNIGGLLIGAVETTSHAVCNALTELRADPARLAAARAAARQGAAAFDGHVFEALRFRPAFPYFFRVCHRPTDLAPGTPHQAAIAPGTTVLAVTQSAMFDPEGFPDPGRFDPARDFSDTFTFGMGHHECLGRHIAEAMVPEITRQILLTDQITLAAAPDYRGGTVPAFWRATRA